MSARMRQVTLATTCALALCTSAFGEITHWVSGPYQPDVDPGDDPTCPDFNDGSCWTVDLMVTISGDDDWTSTSVDANLSDGQFFYHGLGDRTPALATDVNIYPALEYDTMALSTEADGSNQPPFKDPLIVGDPHFEPQNFQVDVWFEWPPNGGDGDFVIARFTVKLTGEQALLTLDGDSTTENYGGELFPFSFLVPIGGPLEDCNNNGIWDSLDMANCDGSPWCSDCNNNGIIDECDILDGTSDDVNQNGVPDECECVGDASGDGDTDQVDLAFLLAWWSKCEGDPGYDPAGDLNCDGCINHADLGILLGDWGCDMNP